VVWRSGAVQLLHPVANTCGQRCHLLLRNSQNAFPEGCELLLSVGHARWQRSHVPVNVRMSLIAAQCEKIHPLGAHFSPHRFSDAINPALNVEIFLDRKVARDLLPVFPWCDQRPTVQVGILVEKGDRRLVFVDDVGGVVGVPRPVSTSVTLFPRRPSVSPCSPLSLSPCPRVPPSPTCPVRATTRTAPGCRTSRSTSRVPHPDRA
jgi:hypothetical protein